MSIEFRQYSCGRYFIPYIQASTFTSASMTCLFAPTPTYAFNVKFVKSGMIKFVHMSEIFRNFPVEIYHCHLW